MFSPGSPPSANNYFGNYFSPSNLSHNQPTPPPGSHYFQQTPARPSTSPPYTSPITRHARFSTSRKSDDFEPMSTSPAAPTHHPHSSSSNTSFLPAFLTGEPHTSGLHLGARSPEARRRLPTVSFDPSVLFETSKTNSKPTPEPGPRSGEPAAAAPIKTGPPISGLLNGKDSSPQLVNVKSTPSIPIGIGSGDFSPSATVVGSIQSSNGNAAGETTVWVTVFGFPSSSAAFVFRQFSQCGTILEAKSNPGANWTHFKYSNTIEARRALNKNGTILAGTMMVGVVPCEAPGSGQTYPSEEQDHPHMSSFSGAPSKQTLLSPQPSNPELKNRLRPLGTAQNSEVHLPRQTHGVMNTALEWLFGW